MTASSTSGVAPRIEARGVSKSFPGVQALAEVDFDVRAGEVHVLVGENGAGKSTLVKILSGVYHVDGGEVRLGGEPMHFDTPHDALQAGIATVYQEFNLIPYMTVAQNVFLGREPTHGVFLDRGERNRRTLELMRELDIEFDPNLRVEQIGVAHRQMVEILKALATETFSVLILDEPTAAISRHEIDVLFNVIRRLRERGVALIYISHRLEEIAQIGDRVTVFRDGHRVATNAVSDIDTHRIIELMVGREMTQLFPERTATPGDVALEVEALSLASGRVEEASFAVRRGEVVGMFGLVGAGRTETLRGLFGADRLRAGRIKLFGEQVAIRSPRKAVKLGLGLAPEERKQQGIFAFMSVAENIGISALDKAEVGPFVSPGKLRGLAAEYVQKLRIATPNVRTPIRSLSGGNQQKCILARLLAADSDVLLLDEPTRGIDVGARAAVYELIDDLAAQGKAILFVSSDLAEIIGVSDRVIVFRRGRIAAEFPRAQLNEQAIMRAAVPERLEAE